MSEENPVVARIWFEIQNAQRHTQCWEWMEESPTGKYILHKDVLAIIEKYLYTSDATYAQQQAALPDSRPVEVNG